MICAGLFAGTRASGTAGVELNAWNIGSTGDADQSVLEINGDTISLMTGLLRPCRKTAWTARRGSNLTRCQFFKNQILSHGCSSPV